MQEAFVGVRKPIVTHLTIPCTVTGHFARRNAPWVPPESKKARPLAGRTFVVAHSYELLPAHYGGYLFTASFQSACIRNSYFGQCCGPDS